MDINKKNRTELKQYFKERAKPTESEFADMIDANINQAEDGVAKLPGDPLSIMAEGDTLGTQEVLNLYSDFNEKNPNWSFNLNPRVESDDPNTAKAGLNIKDATGESRMFIKSGEAHVGIGTIEPTAPLTIKGVDNSAKPNENMQISGNSILFGGDNANEHEDSAKVKVDGESLKIYGKSTGGTSLSRKVDIYSENGMTLKGSVAIDGDVTMNDLKADNIHIAGNSLFFGDDTANENTDSAKVKVEGESLEIYGKSTDDTSSTRKVDIFSENGMTVKGSVAIDGDVTMKHLKADNISASSDLDEKAASDEKIPTQKAVKGYIDTRLPQGLISMWSGKVAPEGWALCDGSNGTPNLAGRFIVGYDDNNDAYHTVGNIGGQEAVVLNKEQLPSHSHTGITSSEGEHNHKIMHSYSTDEDGDGKKSLLLDGENIGTHTFDSENEGEHHHTFQTDATGGNEAHENRPPYYVLAYIMKL